MYVEKAKNYHEGDAGFDIFCPEDIAVPGNARGFSVKFGIRCEMIEEKTVQIFDHHTKYRQKTSNVSYFLAPRSSISNTPLRLANSIGIIDAGYRGELMAKVDNVGTLCINGVYLSSEGDYILHQNDFSIKKGERLFQIVNPSLSPFSVKILEDGEELSSTSRGEGGFGSTGK